MTPFSSFEMVVQHMSPQHRQFPRTRSAQGQQLPFPPPATEQRSSRLFRRLFFFIAFWRSNSFCLTTLAQSCHLRLTSSAVRPTFDMALIIAAIARHALFLVWAACTSDNLPRRVLLFLCIWSTSTSSSSTVNFGRRLFLGTSATSAIVD